MVATLESHDTKTDLAIIKISGGAKLTVITIGTSSDLMPGEPVIAVGNAYGYEHTVTCGIISALHRVVQVSDSQKYRDLIQTDASINPGNSGGPLLNIDGEMIGINVAVRAGAQGIGFAIPVDMAMSVAANLMSAQRIGNTWHGIVSKAESAASTQQVVVDQIDEESPAAKCGLKPGDVITAVGDSPVVRALDLERAMLGHKPGEEVALTVHRNNQPVQVSLVLASAPKGRGDDGDSTWRMVGLRLEPVPAKQFQAVQDALSRRADRDRRAAQQSRRAPGNSPRRRPGGHAHLGDGVARQRRVHSRPCRLRVDRAAEVLHPAR